MWTIGYRQVVILLSLAVLPLMLSAQSATDSLNRLSYSLSPLSFAGLNPSLQGGLFYRLSERTAVDAEGSFLLAERNFDRSGYNNIGFISKFGYMISIKNPHNYWVARLYYRNSRAVGSQSYSRFDGKYIERIDYNTVTNIGGLTVGWLRYTQHDMFDFQVGLSAGLGKQFVRGAIPQDAVSTSRDIWGWLSEVPTEEGSSIKAIAYLDFKILF